LVYHINKKKESSFKTQKKGDFKMKKTMAIGISFALAAGLFLADGALAAVKQQSRKKDGTCQIYETVTQGKDLLAAGQKKQLRKKDGSCQV
jgi:hypothetical protein